MPTPTEIQDRAWTFIAASESGQISLDPRDSGNWTSGVCGIGTLRGSKWGVSASAFPTTDIASLSEIDAKEICMAHYWPSANCVDLCRMEAFGLAIMMLDTCWISGPREAIKTLQTTLKINADGDFGNITRNTLQHGLQAAALYGLSTAQHGLIAEYAAERLLYESDLPRWQIYKGGWTHRITRCVTLASSVLS